MLNIDHGVLNPRSLIEIEKQSQVGGGGCVNPFSQKLEHSTIEGQHSQYRKSAKVLTCQAEKRSPGPASRPFPGPRPAAGATTSRRSHRDTIPPQALVTTQSCALITSCMAQSMIQGQHNMTGPGASNSFIDHCPKASL